MTDKPIIFSAPMIRALLAGRKTQTRRVLKPQPDPSLPIGGADFVVMEGDPGQWCWINGHDGSILAPFSVPYAPGDRLWVREAHALDGTLVRYYATDDVHELRHKRSPIHMPRWASRLTLTVTDVRVQRVQEVSDEDAFCEGVEQRVDATCRDDFRGLWNSIHGPDAWGANPWVAAISFTVERRNIDQ